jgi:hypothetical protein
MKTASVQFLRLARIRVTGFLIFGTVLFLAVVPLKFAIPLIPGVAIFLYVIVRFNSRSTGYRYKHCLGRFKVSTWIDFCSPHLQPQVIAMPALRQS